MGIVILKNGLIEIDKAGQEITHLNSANPYALAEVLTLPMTLEPGISLRQLFRALKPWSNFVSALASIDFNAWFEAVSQTYLCSVNERDEYSPTAIEVYPEIRTEFCKDRILSVTCAWDMRGVYADKTGTLQQCASSLGLAFIKPALLGSLPVLIREVIFEDEPDVISFEPTITSTRPDSHDHLSIRCTLLDTVIMGIFYPLSYFGSPEMAEESFQALIDFKNGSHGSSVTYSLDPEEPLEEGVQPFSNFLKELGIDETPEVDTTRHNRIEMMTLLTKITLPNQHLEDATGLSQIGLERLRAGAVSDYTSQGLQKLLSVVRNAVGAATDAA